MILKALFLLGMLALSLSMRLSESHLDEYAEFLKAYQYEKRKAQVMRQKPTEFDPTRYISTRNYNGVDVKNSTIRLRP